MMFSRRLTCTMCLNPSHGAPSDKYTIAETSELHVFVPQFARESPAQICCSKWYRARQNNMGPCGWFYLHGPMRKTFVYYSDAGFGQTFLPIPPFHVLLGCESDHRDDYSSEKHNHRHIVMEGRHLKRPLWKYIKLLLHPHLASIRQAARVGASSGLLPHVQKM